MSYLTFPKEWVYLKILNKFLDRKIVLMAAPEKNDILYNEVPYFLTSLIFNFHQIISQRCWFWKSMRYADWLTYWILIRYECFILNFYLVIKITTAFRICCFSFPGVLHQLERLSHLLLRIHFVKIWVRSLTPIHEGFIVLLAEIDNWVLVFPERSWAAIVSWDKSFEFWTLLRFEKAKPSDVTSHKGRASPNEKSSVAGEQRLDKRGSPHELDRCKDTIPTREMVERL